MRRALIALAACLALQVARAESPQPTPAMLEEAKELFARLSPRPGMTNALLATGLARYFGQEIEAIPPPADVTTCEFYLVRRDPKTGYVTYLVVLGSRLRD